MSVEVPNPGDAVAESHITYHKGPGAFAGDRTTVLGIPTRGCVRVEALVAWRRLRHPLNVRVSEMFVVGAEVGYARNGIVKQVLQEAPNTRYILWLDDDVVPPPDGWLRLLDVAARGYEIVSGLYPGKQTSGLQTTGFPQAKGAKPIDFKKLWPGDPDPFNAPLGSPYTKDWQPGDVVEVDATLMGFCLVDVNVFRRMIPGGFVDGVGAQVSLDSYPWYQSVNRVAPDGSGYALTEDSWFCLKAREVGARIACDTGILCGHVEDGLVLCWPPDWHPGVGFDATRWGERHLVSKNQEPRP